MKLNTFRAFLAMGALALGASSLTTTAGCVADRPSRNGVYNENQYLRKGFLISGDGSADPGWFLSATITKVSTPNPLGTLQGVGLFPGEFSGGQLFRFKVTSDKLQMVNVRQISGQPSNTRTDEVINAWPATNIDLKYRVNLDGEKTNFYEENQELDWQVRQWVKINFDKNDMSDVAPFGQFLQGGLSRCGDMADASVTLVPGSFKVEDYGDSGADMYKNYLQFSLEVTVPVLYTDAACVAGYGNQAVSAGTLGRQNVTFQILYSMVRAKPVDDPATQPDAYVPLEVDEKDPIRHKYGVFNFIPISRDPKSDLLAGRQLALRFNPNKPIVYYFSPGVPPMIMDAFLGHRQYDTLDAQKADTAGTCLVAGCKRKPDGIMDATNEVLTKSGAQARLSFLNYNDAKVFGDGQGPVRDDGDVRYSWVRWIADIDNGADGLLGLAGPQSDTRTGESLSAQVNLYNYPVKPLAYQIDYYLQSIGASAGWNYTDTSGKPADWPKLGACHEGDVVPLKNSVVQANHNGNSSLYAKMQQYLQKPAPTYGNLGPQDFVAKQDADFFRAYYTILPYQIFADPDANPFVVREGGKGIYGPAQYWEVMAKEAEFQKIAASIDRGETPFEDVTGPNGLKNATDFTNKLRDLTLNHKRLNYIAAFNRRLQNADAPSAFNLLNILQHAGRHCIKTFDDSGNLVERWQTRDEWVNGIISSWYEHVSIHEFGHALGLQHNFMGSIDKNNWVVKKDQSGNPVKDAQGNFVYTLYSSSQMEYGGTGAEMYNVLQWGTYDKGALGWTYGNAQKATVTTNDDGTTTTTITPPVPTATTPRGDSISGQSSAGNTSLKAPWADPYGFDAKGNEVNFLYCHHEHLPYTPLCRQHDSGTTPSEIIANEIDQYDWSFAFTNYRVYRKFWNNTNYANGPVATMTEMRRFLSLWLFDWGGSELADTLRRVGLKNPDPNGSDLQYFAQLTNKFNTELSYANKMVASFHKAVIQQSNGERPVRTVYDKYYGDVTQQGIILDKLFAMQNWVALWPSDNYDPNQAGAYIASYSDCPDNSFQYTAEDAVSSMIGGQYDAFPYFAPLAVATFAQDTHNPAFSGRLDVRNWIGGVVFNRLQDFLDYFRDIAVKNSVPGCTDISTCKYDPRSLSDTHNEFIGPDKKAWIWAYIPNRNAWTAVQKDINTASYLILRAYTDDVVYQLDDGAFPGGAYRAELPVKYYLDSFTQYN